MLTGQGAPGAETHEAQATTHKTAQTTTKVNVVNRPLDVLLTAEDGVNLQATHYPGTGRSVLLVHMLNSRRQSYDVFAGQLSSDFAVLSIDLRGHGGSDLDWKSFSDDDFRAMVLDVKAGVEFLRGQGYEEIILVGASIGANSVLNYAAEDPTINSVVLLSPGMDYRGISIEEGMLSYSRRLLVVASESDEYSFSTAEQIMQMSMADKVFMPLNGSAHGTDMLDGSLMKKIVTWIKA
ncbi:MAG: alpha/beta hydrolase [archaeon]